MLNCDHEFHDDEVVGKEMVEKVHSSMHNDVYMCIMSFLMSLQVKEFVSGASKAQ